MSSSAAPPPVVDDAATDPTDGSAVALDPGAVDLAKAAAVAEAGIADHVGEFIAAVTEDDIAITATFVARLAGYAGWHWSVTLAILDQAATVSEVVLLPGEGSLLAPAWIPWDQRIRPGDVGVGDLLPPIENDPRLVPAYIQSDDPAVEAVAHELGIGRVHVLSREGRVDFAERLHDGTFGPAGEIALAAPANCFSCAFYLPLAGSLGQLVGACSNEYSPADGRVVDAEFGCGAHSETVIEMPARSATTLAVIDELSLEVFRRPAHHPATTTETEAESGTGQLEAAAPEADLFNAEMLDAETPGVDTPEPEVADEVVVDDAIADDLLVEEPIDDDVLDDELVSQELITEPEVTEPDVTEPVEDPSASADVGPDSNALSDDSTDAPSEGSSGTSEGSSDASADSSNNTSEG